MSTIKFNDKDMIVNDDWSWKDFTQRDLTGETIPPGIVYQSCFQQDKPNTNVFPASMMGVTFVNCNLNNVIVPEHNVVIGGSQIQHTVIDGEEWIVDSNLKKVRLLNEPEAQPGLLSQVWGWISGS